MARNPRYDILFEPVKIGPVTAKNRFYQVPHASSTGNDMPNTRAGLRAIRAEGGWAVVCSGYCSIHPTADDSPHRYSRLWDEEDVKNLAQMTDAVHEHGALAGVELFHGGTITRNRFSREMPLRPRACLISALSAAGSIRCTAGPWTSPISRTWGAGR
jgi:dimethylamine/trimethylamine dehydrogenase